MVRVLKFSLSVIVFLTAEAKAKTPSYIQRFPEAGRLVSIIKGGLIFPYSYQGSVPQLTGLVQAAYALSPVLAIEVDGGIGSNSYPYVGSRLVDSVSATSIKTSYYIGGALRLKPFYLNDHVNINLFIGGHYVSDDFGIDTGFQVESRTGKIGLMIGLAVSMQVNKVTNVFPFHINLGADYSITKEIAVLFQIDIGLGGGRFGFFTGMMFSL